uniref:LR gamma8 n=1 Tax=Griffithsia pacifica TaxID=35689 RepID=A0A291FEC7_GRIPA|nr:LR gamma8 [Griffithsia pacifica]5Y6P_hY Chain hY, LR_gamma8 [Griffithsia pacifica]5Y6P_hZ Chain hZ, LR_gamma8 [Griffithsia pacifica]5Y6P_ly Chain ly, LR_gamma8 [Griffithsia pacifica]5Y6P_lz Chain lz, LR_gamma8 [Griffithsia pacifica]
MEPAFVSSFAPKPVITTSLTASSPLSVTARKNAVSTPTMAAYSLDKYAQMSGANAVDTSGASPAASSTWWVAYRDSLKERFNPFRAPANPEVDVGKSKEYFFAQTAYGRILNMVNASRFGKGGDPDELVPPPGAQPADQYMANCIVKQYKAMATPTGVYTTQCTEGVVRGQAEEARNAALSAAFRMKQRSSAQKFGDFCESRRMAVIGAHGCSYEESLLTKFPAAARAYTTASSEAKGNCVRYADGTSPAETYMAACVDKQMKFRSVPMGVYDVLCSDGNTKGVAEYKRVSAMSVRFRSNQMSTLYKMQAKYNNAAYARNYFGHGCSYEENLFNKYPAVSASMRPSTARY